MMTISGEWNEAPGAVTLMSGTTDGTPIAGP